MIDLRIGLLVGLSLGNLLFGGDVSSELLRDLSQVPRLCGLSGGARSNIVRQSHAATALRGYRVVPSVILAKEDSEFRVFVDLEEGVEPNGVELVPGHPWIPSGRVLFESVDGSLKHWATPPIRLSLFDESSMELYYQDDPEGLYGQAFHSIGEIRITTEGKPTGAFLIQPVIGLLDPSVPSVRTRSIAERLQSSSHLINISSFDQATARGLRSISTSGEALLQRVFEDFPDRFDFCVLVPTSHVEVPSSRDPINFVSGRHLVGDRLVWGLGVPIARRAANFGSAGRLKSVILVDSGSRGLVSANVTHEILHHWGSYLPEPLGFKGDHSHYAANSNVGSLLGGFRWEKLVNGAYRIDLEEGANGAQRAANLDLYLMGLIDPYDVSPVLTYRQDVAPQVRAISEVGIEDVKDQVPIDDILAQVGNRLPSSDIAQRHFSIAFILDTHKRMATMPEMTFYSRLASRFTESVSPTDPLPFVGDNWNSISRFFGEDIYLTSRVLSFDDDQDGLPDDWENWFFGSRELDSNDDPDRDGYDNLSEFAFGGSPLNHDALDVFSRIQVGDQEILRIARRESVIHYELWQSWDLRTWTRYPASAQLGGLDIPIKTDAVQFFRIEIE